MQLEGSTSAIAISKILNVAPQLKFRNFNSSAIRNVQGLQIEDDTMHFFQI
jgi:hypothetical protein